MKIAEKILEKKIRECESLINKCVDQLGSCLPYDMTRIVFVVRRIENIVDQFDRSRLRVS